MELKEIEALIRYHQAGLDQYLQHISPSAQYLEKVTIKALEELREITTLRIQEAQEILTKRKSTVE